MRRILIIVAIFFMIPGIILADCTKSDLDRLGRLANNISYIFEEDSYDVRLNITVTGLSNELYYVYEIPPVDINYEGDFGEATIRGVAPGTIFSIYAYGNNICSGNLIREISIATENYNSFYTDPLCDKAKGFRLCQKWIKADVSYDEFVKSANEYINSYSKSTDNKSSVVIRDFYYYYNRYYWPVLITTILTLVLLIYLWIKQNNKNKL